MKPYFRIRIDKDTIIKVPTRTGGMGECLYLFFSETFDINELGMEVGGEIASGLRAWIAGTRTFPVTENGILDLYGALVEGLMAQRTLSGNDPIKFPLVDVHQYDIRKELVSNQPQEQQVMKYQSPVPEINVDAIAEAIRKRK